MSPLSARLSSSHEEDTSQRGGGTERWLLTYSDMITLLLVLFVVLYSLSSLNQQKYSEFIKGVNSAFHGNNIPTNQGAPGSGQGKQYPTTKLKPYASVAEIKAALVGALTKAGLISDVTISTNSQGLTEGFVAGKLFYGKDIAQLTPLGNRVVDVTATVIREFPNNAATVEGYADNEPIYGGPYFNNWALSAARAVYVVTRLNDLDRVNPQQLTTEALGQYHPVVPNNNPAHQAENRRVNIAIAGPPTGQ